MPFNTLFGTCPKSFVNLWIVLYSVFTNVSHDFEMCLFCKCAFFIGISKKCVQKTGTRGVYEVVAFLFIFTNFTSELYFWVIFFSKILIVFLERNFEQKCNTNLNNSRVASWIRISGYFLNLSCTFT